jgi:nitrate/nitrite transport system substrate-binding protein
MWFMTQFRRWGLLRDDPDYLGVARQVQQLAVPRGRHSLGALPRPTDAQQPADRRQPLGRQRPRGYARSFSCTPWTRPDARVGAEGDEHAAHPADRRHPKKSAASRPH